uniref:Uncharacterized protein n=1 Tax=Ciona intestinalis TaxID=7719 RepID=H2XUF3_CIOIN
MFVILLSGVQTLKQDKIFCCNGIVMQTRPALNTQQYILLTRGTTIVYENTSLSLGGHRAGAGACFSARGGPRMKEYSQTRSSFTVKAGSMPTEADRRTPS